MVYERLIHEYRPHEIHFVSVCMGKTSNPQLHRGYNTTEERDEELRKLEKRNSKVLRYYPATNHGELDRMEKAAEIRKREVHKPTDSALCDAFSIPVGIEPSVGREL